MRDAFKEYYSGKKMNETGFDELKKKQEEKMSNIFKLKSGSEQNSVSKDIRIM